MPKAVPAAGASRHVHGGRRRSRPISAISRRRSRRLWPVGPVTTASPKAVNMGQASKAARDDFRWNPKAWARVDRSGIGDGPGRLGVAVDAIGAGAEHGEPLARIALQLQRAGHDKLLVAAAGAGGAVECHRHLADRDQAEPRVDGAQGVEALQQIAGGVGVVPVVAGVVHHHVEAGLLRQGAGVFRQVVAGEQKLEDRIAKGRVLADMVAAAVMRRAGAHPAMESLGKKGGCQPLLPGDSGRSSRSKKARIEGGSLAFKIVLVEQCAHLGHGGVVGRSGAGGERVERTQRHVGQQQADLGGLRRGDGQPSAFDRGKMLAQGVDFADGRAGGQQQLMEGDGVVERDLRVQRQIEHGRAAAGDEEEDQRVFSAFLSMASAARAAAKDSSLGSGWPPSK